STRPNRHASPPRRERASKSSFSIPLCTGTVSMFADIRHAWNRARDAAGLDAKVTPHILRHTRATWLMRAGVDIWEASHSLGMSTKTLEAVYGHHHASFQSKAAEV
ncbi:hypothetical protein ELZ22_17615, partial [Brucella abortus]